MSDVADQTAVAETDPTVSTEVADQGTDVDVPVTEEHNTFEQWDQFADYEVPIQVDGQTQYVKFSDIPNNLMFQADYTRKTQELAQEREQYAQAKVIYDALEADPAKAVELLKTAYLDGQRAQDDQSEEPVFLTDEERQLHEVQQWISQEEERRQEEAVRSELEGLVQQYGVDRNELVNFAIQINAPDLTTAYAHMHLAKSQAQQAATAQQQQEQQAREAAAAAAQVVTGGTSRNPAATAQPEHAASLDEAWELALRDPKVYE